MTRDVIDSDLTGSGRIWRNNITGECRTEPPRIGELDWIEEYGSGTCAVW